MFQAVLIFDFLLPTPVVIVRVLAARNIPVNPDNISQIDSAKTNVVVPESGRFNKNNPEPNSTIPQKRLSEAPGFLFVA